MELAVTGHSVTNSGETDHRFGGPWTEVKLNAVTDYLRFFTSALRHQPSVTSPFETWYVDAFAGTGDRVIETRSASMFESARDTFDRARLEGSARRALRVDPPFQHLVFIEKDSRRFEALERIRREFCQRDIVCVCGDANDEIRRIFEQGSWVDPVRRGLQRAVVFLDPYGMSVRWETLELLANTRRADVWYLFPLHAALRQLSHDHRALDLSKRAALNEVFGTSDWEDRFYQQQTSQEDLFGLLGSVLPDRIANPRKIEQFAAERLRTIFSFVSDPIPILTRRKLQQFSLFLLSGNQNPRAMSLIRRGVAAQIKKYGPRDAMRER